MRFFSWGSNFAGQLCAGYRSKEDIISPIEVKPFKDSFLRSNELISIIGGRDQTFFLFQNGEVYGCGLNHCGQLGELPLYVPLPKLIKSLLKYKITMLSARNESAYAITTEGTCIGWGSNSDGQLGIAPDELTSSSKPKVLCKNAVQVSAGGCHVAILKKNGKLLTTGIHKFGELGRTLTSHFKPAPAHIPSVASFACGESHTIAITKDGKLYGWGNNFYGQTGTKPSKDDRIVWFPKIVKTEYVFNSSKSIPKCGRKHNIIYAEDSEILTWGRNQYGQISGVVHEPEYDWEPTLLSHFYNVKDVAVGGNHNVIMNQDGRIHFFGWTEGGCSSKIDHKHRTPFLIKTAAADPNNIFTLEGILIGAGEKHSVAVVH